MFRRVCFDFHARYLSVLYFYFFFFIPTFPFGINPKVEWASFRYFYLLLFFFRVLFIYCLYLQPLWMIQVVIDLIVVQLMMYGWNLLSTFHRYGLIHFVSCPWSRLIKSNEWKWKCLDSLIVHSNWNRFRSFTNRIGVDLILFIHSSRGLDGFICWLSAAPSRVFIFIMQLIELSRSNWIELSLFIIRVVYAFTER